MKKNIQLLLILFLFFMTVSVQAQEKCDADSCSDEEICCGDTGHVYVKICAGTNFLKNTVLNGNNATYQAGYIVSGMIGYRLCYGFSLEAEYAYRRNDIDGIVFVTEGGSNTGYVQCSSGMANLIWDLPLEACGCSLWDIHPFIGGGIGYDYQQMDSSNDRIIFYQDWSQFSWQLMAGLAYPIFCNTDILLEYKYHQGSCRFYNHSLDIGLTYKFGF